VSAFLKGKSFEISHSSKSFQEKIPSKKWYFLLKRNLSFTPITLFEKIELILEEEKKFFLERLSKISKVKDFILSIEKG